MKQFLLQGLGVTFLAVLVVWAWRLRARVLSGMLNGVSPSDLTTLLAVLFLMLVVAAWAAMLPALRAAQIDPMQVLREE